ncbi:hypothetical protein M0P65_04810 [Candidatus Gracilibacteria bacterium]|nr:hypothetical protein [Candidatus Gracilibacteria bacterium]
MQDLTSFQEKMIEAESGLRHIQKIKQQLKSIKFLVFPKKFLQGKNNSFQLIAEIFVEWVHEYHPTGNYQFFQKY